MANPNMIGGGRMTRGEMSGDKRRFEAKKINVGALLLRLWHLDTALLRYSGSTGLSR